MAEPHEQHRLTESQIEAEIAAADGFLAAAGYVVSCPGADEDLRQALRGQLTFDEVVERAAAHAARQGLER